MNEKLENNNNRWHCGGFSCIVNLNSIRPGDDGRPIRRLWRNDGGGYGSGYGYNSPPYTTGPSATTPSTQYYQAVYPFMFEGGMMRSYGYTHPTHTMERHWALTPQHQ